MSYFHDIKVKQKNDGIFISPNKNLIEILEKFKMDSCNVVNTSVATGLNLSKEGEGELVNSN